MQQLQQAPAAPIYSDGYGNYIPTAPAPPQFGTMAQMGSQFNSYDFQATTAYPPPAPNFNVGGIACPAPPGMSDGWAPPPTIQPEESEEDRLKREGEKIEFDCLMSYSRHSIMAFSCCRWGEETTTWRVKETAWPVHCSFRENEARIERTEAAEIRLVSWPGKALAVAQDQRLHQGERKAPGKNHFSRALLEQVWFESPSGCCVGWHDAQDSRFLLTQFRISRVIPDSMQKARRKESSNKKCFSFFFSGVLRKFVWKMIKLMSCHLSCQFSSKTSRKPLLHS